MDDAPRIARSRRTRPDSSFLSVAAGAYAAPCGLHIKLVQSKTISGLEWIGLKKKFSLVAKFLLYFLRQRLTLRMLPILFGKIPNETFHEPGKGELWLRETTI